MTAEDFQTIRDLLTGTSELIDGIRRLCMRDPSTSPADVRAHLAQLQTQLVGLIDTVQNRRRAEWELTRPTESRPIPRVAKPLESSDLPDVSVRRFDMNGQCRDHQTPPLSGTWGGGNRNGARS